MIVAASVVLLAKSRAGRREPGDVQAGFGEAIS
jgi:hypothetical protein